MVHTKKIFKETQLITTLSVRINYVLVFIAKKINKSQLIELCHQYIHTSAKAA